MTYDPVDANDDGVVESDVDNGSVSTGDINNRDSVAPDAEIDGVQAVADSHTGSEWSKIELHPSGEYNVHDTERLRLPDKTILEGHGAQLIGNGDPSTDAHLLLTNKDWSTQSKDIIVRDLNVDGKFTTKESAAKSTDYGGLVQFTNARNVNCENLFIDQGYRHDFQFTKCIDSVICDSVFERARGDDPLSVSDGGAELGGTLGASVSRLIYVENSTARNFSSPETGFEVDDGPKLVFFDGCRSEPTDATGFSVKTHQGDTPPQDIYFNNCHTANNIFVRTNTASTDEVSGDVKRIFINDTHIGNSLIARTRDTYVRGGEIANSAIVEDDPSNPATFETDGVHFSDRVGTAQYCVEVRNVDKAHIHNADFVELGNSRGVWVHPDGVTASGVKITDSDFSHSNQDKSAIDLQPINGGVIDAPIIKDNETENANNGIRVRGTASNYSGIGKIVANTMNGSNFNALWFSDDLTPRQHLITRGNYGESFSAGQNLNASSEVPASPTQGLRYLDDGTNTGSGNPADRYYDGTAFVDL